MSIHSMTGFGRSSGRSGVWGWAWEIRTVNSKGLDLRLRLPPGFDAVDIEARAAISAISITSWQASSRSCCCPT